MGRKKITICQKIKVLTLLQEDFTYEKVRNQLGISKDCITIVAKQEESKLSLKNHSGQSRKKSTTTNEDRYLFNLMKKGR